MFCVLIFQKEDFPFFFCFKPLKFVLLDQVMCSFYIGLPRGVYFIRWHELRNKLTLEVRGLDALSINVWVLMCAE